MKDLKSTKALVKSILEKNVKTRNSDSYLYLAVITAIAKEYHCDLSKISVEDFLMNLSGSAFPPFESVRRTRQKIQRECPHLSACAAVSELRAENEEVYREFARS